MKTAQNPTNFRGSISTLLLLIGVVFGIQSTTLGQQANTSENNKVQDTKNFNDRIQLSIQLSQKEVSSAQPILLQVMLKNISSDEITFSITNVENLFHISIKDTEGELMPLTRYGKMILQTQDGPIISGRVIRVLKIGDEAKFKILINRFYDMSVPGEYSVTVTKALRLGKAENTTDVVSNTVKVCVGGFDASERSNPKPAEDAQR